MSHLMKIHAVCEFSYFCLWYLTVLKVSLETRPFRVTPKVGEHLAQRIGCSPFMQEVQGSTPTGGTCPNNFFDPIDQDIRTQCALS